MPEDYGFIISPSGDARHIHKRGKLRLGFSSPKVTWIPKEVKCQGPAMMIQWLDKAGNLRMKRLPEGFAPLAEEQNVGMAAVQNRTLSP